jgi:hypothetical protein
MVDDPAYIRDLRALTRTEPDFSHLENLERELYVSGSDRATAVMLGSFLEVNLERLLSKQMRSDLNSKDRRQIFEYEGALGTLSSKIVVAYALKLIGPITKADLNLIRLLRNEFAHSRIPFNFTTPEVWTVCEKFPIVDLPGAVIPSGYLLRISRDEREGASKLTHPRTRFVTECHVLSYRMIMATHGPREGDLALPGPLLP